MLRHASGPRQWKGLLCYTSGVKSWKEAIATAGIFAASRAERQPPLKSGSTVAVVHFEGISRRLFLDEKAAKPK
jgi:hypothetical protein